MSEWILTKTRPPKPEEFPVCLGMRLSNGPHTAFAADQAEFDAHMRTEWRQWTHWCQHRFPDPPKEETQEERDHKAFMEWWNKKAGSIPPGKLGLGPVTTPVAAWHAALAWERERTAGEMAAVRVYVAELNKLGLWKGISQEGARDHNNAVDALRRLTGLASSPEGLQPGRGEQP